MNYQDGSKYTRILKSLKIIFIYITQFNDSIRRIQHKLRSFTIYFNSLPIFC